MKVTLYMWSKKIHRWAVVFVVVLTLIMGGTGTTLRYPLQARELGIDVGMARELHGTMSIYFSIILAVMLVTGVYMFVFPYIQKWGRKAPETSE